MKRLEPIILVAAIGFYSLAMTSQGIIPLLEKDITSPTTVTTVDGKTVSVPQRTALEQLGRKVYISEGCWYCHSQFVRPVNRDSDKWGPVSQAGEFVYDLPQMLGTRRIGPDLSREGNRRSDAWHYAHHFNPRSTEPESIMPSYDWLFRNDAAHDRAVLDFIGKHDKNHDGRVTRSELDANGDGTVAADELPANWKQLDSWPANDDGSVGDGIIDMHDYGPVPTEKMLGLEAYLQKIGTAIGDWRSWEPWPTMSRGHVNEPLELRVKRGAEIFAAKCSGCHGAFGNGRTAADTTRSDNFNVAYHFLSPQPRDLTTATFKSRTTASGELPTDEDIFRIITRGIRKGQIMPAWGNAANGHILTEQDRWDLVDYVKSLSTRFRNEPPPKPIEIPQPPYDTLADVPATTIAEGKMVYRLLQCWSCHGQAGKGDGPSASTLVDDFEVPIRPFDFTTGSFKFGDSPADIYRTFNTGLNGTPMPSYFDTIVYPREAFADPSPWKQTDHGRRMFSDDDIAQLAGYVASLPTTEQLGKLSDPERRALADQRRWALVYYALSLASGSNGLQVPGGAGFVAKQ